MKILSKLIPLGALALALIASRAHANTFDYSYTYTDGIVVSGTLDGTLDGNVIDNVSDITLSINGAQIGGTFVATAYDPGSGTYLPTPVVSTDLSQNEFFFSNFDLNGDQSDFDTVFDISNGLGFSTLESFSAGATDEDFAPFGTWSLTAAASGPTSSVPDTGATLLLLGVAAAGLIAARRLSPLMA